MPNSDAPHLRSILFNHFSHKKIYWKYVFLNLFFIGILIELSIILLVLLVRNKSHLIFHTCLLIFYQKGNKKVAFVLMIHIWL